MNKWKIAFWSLLVVLIITVCFSFYMVLDQGVTITHQREGYIKTENDLDQIIQFINETDLTKKEIIQSLQDHRWAEYMNFDSDTIELERTSLIFENDSLVRIAKQW